MIDTLLGLDIGTTSTKAVLFDLGGNELARKTSAPYRFYTPNPGWVEQDPEEIWQAALSTIHDLLKNVTTSVHVLALCLAAQSGSLLPANEKGEPVYPLITWMDGRTAKLVERWQNQGLEAKVKAISGWSLYPGLCLPTIAWLRKHMPEVHNSAQKYFSVNDFIAFRLTGLQCTNPSNGGGMQLVDIDKGDWSETLCDLAGITPGNLSRIKPTGAVIGRLHPELCHLTGLSTDTLLVSGGHDQGCTALGLGIISPGKHLLACGTAWVITGITTAQDLQNIPENLDINFHTVQDRWTISQSLGGLGASLEWWSGQAWRGAGKQSSREEIYTALDQELTTTRAGAGGLFFLPMTGGHSGPATVQKGGFVGLQLGHTRADMARAILEGAAFELRWTLDIIKSAALPVDRLWMVGGAAKSALWPQILATATGTPICLPQYDNWPALGAAIIAGIGAGVFDSLAQGLDRFQKPTRSIEPGKSLGNFYEHCFHQYQQQVKNNASLLFSK